MKGTVESNTSSTFSCRQGGTINDTSPLTTNVRDYFDFHITNFPFIRSNILSSSAYGFFNSHLISFAMECFSYECPVFIDTCSRFAIMHDGYSYTRTSHRLPSWANGLTDGFWGATNANHGISLSETRLSLIVYVTSKKYVERNCKLSTFGSWKIYI